MGALTVEWAVRQAPHRGLARQAPYQQRLASLPPGRELLLVASRAGTRESDASRRSFTVRRIAPGLGVLSLA